MNGMSALLGNDNPDLADEFRKMVEAGWFSPEGIRSNKIAELLDNFRSSQPDNSSWSDVGGIVGQNGASPIYQDYPDQVRVPIPQSTVPGVNQIYFAKAHPGGDQSMGEKMITLPSASKEALAFDAERLSKLNQEAELRRRITQAGAANDIIARRNAYNWDNKTGVPDEAPIPVPTLMAEQQAMNDPAKVLETLLRKSQIEHTQAQTKALGDKPIGVAPTMTEVLDPKDETRLLRVDARAYKGGTLGDAGVLGISGKEPVAAKKAEQVDSGRQSLSDITDQLRSYYDNLEKTGGIPDVSKGAMSNITAGIASSTPGQMTGKLFGTENQSMRNSIVQQRPLLLQAIKQATGMSAKQMDSNAEMKLYLQAATDPSLDVQTNKRALDLLEKLYGNPKSKSENIEPNRNSTASSGWTVTRVN